MGTLPVLRVTLSSIVISLASFGSAIQSRTPDEALIAALVWGEYHHLDLSPYPMDVQAELDRARRRVISYRSPRRQPARRSDEALLYPGMVRYEGLLAAFAANRQERALAFEYVDRLRRCYEWEGLHGCPEHEASFAKQYLAANPNGPFTEYLPLLAAHRWLCTAEAYDYEKQPQDAARSRREFDAAIRTARQSTVLLIRAGADALQAGRHCIIPR